MQRVIRVLAVWLLIGWMVTGAQAEEKVRTVEVLPDIFMVPPEVPTEANTTFLVSGEGVIVIDPGAGPRQAERVRKAIMQTTDQPVVYIINTHFHGEGTFGNQAFPETKTIIGHVMTTGDMAGKPGRKQLEAARKNEDQNIKLVLPNLLTKDGLDLKLGKFPLRLIYPGTAHTRGDLYVYIPTYRIMITGGLVNKQVIPYLGDALIDAWIPALRKMEDLDAEIIIPGHGPHGDKPTVTLMKHYLMELKTYVMRELEDGGALPDIKKKVSAQLLAKYGEWKNKEGIDENIETAFFEFLNKSG